MVMQLHYGNVTWLHHYIMVMQLHYSNVITLW